MDENQSSLQHTRQNPPLTRRSRFLWPLIESRGPTTDIFSPSAVSTTLSGACDTYRVDHHDGRVAESPSRVDTHQGSQTGSESQSGLSPFDLRRVNLSPAYTSSESPTRSRSPWPPASEGDDSEELEVESGLDPTDDDPSLSQEDILAELHSRTLDPVTFERHALSHISEANEDGTRNSVLSRDWASLTSRVRDTLAGTFERRGGGATSPSTSVLSSDYGTNAHRRSSIFAEVNRPLSSVSYTQQDTAPSVSGLSVPDSPSRRSGHTRAFTEPSTSYLSDVERSTTFGGATTVASTSAPIRHTASPVGRRAAGLIAMFETRSDSGSSVSGSGSGSSLSSLGQVRSTTSGPFSMSASTPLFPTNPRLAGTEQTSTFPRTSNIPSISSSYSRPSSPTKTGAGISRPGSPLKTSSSAPLPPPKEPLTPPSRNAPLPRTPEAAFNRPTAARLNPGKGSPRSPLTSVRNIVAAWGGSRDRDATDAKATPRPSAPVPPAPAEARPYSLREGNLSIRRRNRNGNGEGASETGGRQAASTSGAAAGLGERQVSGSGGGLAVPRPGGLGRPGSDASGRESSMTVPSVHPSEIGSQVSPDQQVSWDVF